MNPIAKPDIKRTIILALITLATVLTIFFVLSMVTHASTTSRLNKVGQRITALNPRPAAAEKIETPPENTPPENPTPDKTKNDEQKQSDNPNQAKKDKPLPDIWAQQVAERNFFVMPEPKGFKAQLTGVLGNRAMFKNGQDVAVGEKIMNATVKKIGPDWVDVEYEGNILHLQVFGQGSSPSQPSPPGASPNRSMSQARGPRPSVTPEVTTQMVEQFKNLPPDIREKALSSMPSQMREKLLQMEKGN